MTKTCTIHEFPPPPPRNWHFVLVQDSRRGVDFPLAVGLVLRSCAVNYLNQTWLEAMDYLMNGVLGDGPWCPWLLDAEVNLRARVSRDVFSFVFCVYSLQARRMAPLM